MKKFDFIVFDIDGTLTESKQPIQGQMVAFLCNLLKVYKVAIISGADFEQFKWQVLDLLPCKEEELGNLYLLPVDGTIFCRYENGWCQYDEPLSDGEKERIKLAFKNIFEKSGLDKPEKIYGELVEDRGAQLNFSALGQDAPPELKQTWDTDNKKRQKMVEVLKDGLPDLSFRIGGTTSIEVTKRGIDKAYGLKKLMKETSVVKDKILYVGDKLFKGGNDEPALNLGIECRQVKNLKDTEDVMIKLLQ